MILNTYDTVLISSISDKMLQVVIVLVFIKLLVLYFEPLWIKTYAKIQEIIELHIDHTDYKVTFLRSYL